MMMMAHLLWFSDLDTCNSKLVLFFRNSLIVAHYNACL